MILHSQNLLVKKSSTGFVAIVAPSAALAQVAEPVTEPFVLLNGPVAECLRLTVEPA